MVVAFSGWNDAGEAATGATSHLLGTWTDEEFDIIPELIAQVDPEDFYDFQVNRPMVNIDETSIRTLTWPGAEVFALATPQLPHDFIVVRGVEPSMKWKRFTAELLDLADDCEVSLVITLGAMLADTPHTRPITVTGTSAHPEIAQRLEVEVSKYEGPTGILGVIADACLRRGIDALSLWAAIPHYASNSPSPKATLALINSLEDFLSISIPQEPLLDESLEWELEVSELAREDVEVSEYVKALEESKDATGLPEATGESIARELERFLRRQNEK
jgi:proteasome assembly chaperone (PAC2) family protein